MTYVRHNDSTLIKRPTTRHSRSVVASRRELPGVAIVNDIAINLTYYRYVPTNAMPLATMFFLYYR